MQHRYESWAAPLTLTLVLGGCTDPDVRSASINAVNPTDTSTAPVTDEWLGQWNGPEGTFLRLEGGKGRYKITIQDLDGPRTYQGTTVGAQIQFDRNGETESIRATSGPETGMKWLIDKADCLTVQPGEGYCRD
jgi:hypothetical protein